MSQAGTGKPPSPAAHGDKKPSGSSSQLGEKNAEVAEKKPASANVSQPPKSQTSGAPAVKKQSASADASKPQIMKPSEAKTASTTKSEPGKKGQSTKPTDSQNKQPSEERQKESSGAKSQISPPVTMASKPSNTGKLNTPPADQLPPATSVETAKPKPEKMSTMAGEAGTGATDASVVAATDQPSIETGMDESALDSLIDTLGELAEDMPASPVYTGPEVKEDILSRYLEEMGKREGSLPPEYVKLLKSKGDGKDEVPPKADELDEKPMTVDELAEALSSDFTCSPAAGEEKTTSLTEKPSKEGEIMQAQEASSVKASVPPKEKKTKSKEEIKDEAVEALLDTLGGPEPEPEPDLTPIVEVSEAKAKEKKEEKVGERDDTIPPEYRLTPELDKDGKPILPKPEEKPKPLSESDLVDEFSKDFSCPVQPVVRPKVPKPSTSKKASYPVSAKSTKDEAIPRARACTVQSSAPSAVSAVGLVTDEALEALSSSLGQREPDPDENKPIVDKVKEKTKQEQHEKLGEDEETIPPEYRLTKAKDKDGEPLLPKPEEKSQPLSENDLLEGLTAGFSRSPLPPAPLPASTVTKRAKEGEKPAEPSDIISAATVSSVHSAAPPAPTTGEKEVDEALDLLSDSLGQREPDPDENKPLVDKVKEKAKSEHRDKLGERDDTIPPDYQKLLESGEQSLPVKPTAKDVVKPDEQKKPPDDSAAIDALSGDFASCAKASATPKHSKDKSGKESITSKPAPKEKGKPKDPKTGRGQFSCSKPEKQKTS